jgi:hypothetical protein
LQNPNGFDAHQNDGEVDEPEQKKANSRGVGKILPSRRERCQQRADCFATDPGLDAEPSTRHQRAEDGGQVGSQHAKRCASQHWKRHSVLGAGVRIQQHRHQHDHVADENRHHRLFPVHPTLDQTRSQHVGEDVDGH